MENNKTTPETSVSTPESTQQATVNNSHQLSNNDIGIAGFVLALLGFLFTCSMDINHSIIESSTWWIIMVLGLTFSFIGVFRKKNNGLAIAGLVISVLLFAGAVIIFLGL